MSAPFALATETAADRLRDLRQAEETLRSLVNGFTREELCNQPMLAGRWTLMHAAAYLRVQRLAEIAQLCPAAFAAKGGR